MGKWESSVWEGWFHKDWLEIIAGENLEKRFRDWGHGSRSKWLEAKVMRRTRNKTEKWQESEREILDSVVAWVSGKKQVFQQVQLHVLQSYLIISDHQISVVKKTLAPVEYAKFWGGCLWVNDGRKKISSLWFKCIILFIYSFELIYGNQNTQHWHNLIIDVN